MDDIYEDFWAAFLEETGTPETTFLENYTYFGDSEEASVDALEQFLSGERTAVSHCVSAYLATKQRMPRIGDYTMVTDFYGNPGCILHTLDVTIAPMSELSKTLIEQECPGVERESWLQDRRKEYTALAERFGFHYNDDLPVLMETVELVYPTKK